MKVTFNTAVTPETALDSDNYEIKVNDINAVDVEDVVMGSGAEDSMILSKDGKEVTMRLASAFQKGDRYVIQAKDSIKAVSGTALERYTSEEKVFSESSEPKLVEVTTLGINTLEIEFDRPVFGDVSMIKVDGIDIDGATSPTTLTQTRNLAGNYVYTVTVTDQNALDEIFEVGNHDVVLYDVADTEAAYPSVASVLTGSYLVDDAVTTPKVEETTVLNANRFFLRTNVPVDLDTAEIKVEKGNHEFTTRDISNAGTSVATGTGVYATTGTYKNQPGVWVVVSDEDLTANGGAGEDNPLYKDGETKANLKVTLEKYKDAATQSLIGQKSVTNVTLDKNNSKPVVKETRVKNASNILVVEFEDEIAAIAGGGLTTSDVIVRDKEGIIVSTSNVTSVNIVAKNAKSVTIEVDLGANYKAADEPYSVEFKKDIIKNKVDNSTVRGYIVNTVKNDNFKVNIKSSQNNFKYKALTLNDVAAGSITSAGDLKVTASVAGGLNDTIELLYGEDMGESARNVSNYLLDGKALPVGSTVDFVDGKDRVKIVLPEGALKSTTSYMFTIKNDVKTKEGSIIVGSIQTKRPAQVLIKLDDTIAPTMVSAVYLRSDEDIKPGSKSNVLEVTMSEDVKLNSVSSSDAKLLDDLKITVAGSSIDIKDIDVDMTNSKRLIVTLDEYVNISQSAKIVAVAEENQKDSSKTTHITDTTGNKLKAGSNVTATNSKFSASVTPAGTISSVGVKTAPTKITYIENENLDLRGLVVTLTKEDGTTEDVAFANFTAKGITTVKVNGDALTVSDTQVVISVNGKTVNQVITVTAAPSSDATLKASSTIKGETITSLGTADATLGDVTAGSVTITSAKAADTTNLTTFVTLFDATDSAASVKVVKYADAGATTDFATDTAYNNEAITTNDFFIIEVTAEDGTVNYYKVVVTVTV